MEGRFVGSLFLIPGSALIAGPERPLGALPGLGPVAKKEQTMSNRKNKKLEQVEVEGLYYVSGAGKHCVPVLSENAIVAAMAFARHVEPNAVVVEEVRRVIEGDATMLDLVLVGLGKSVSLSVIASKVFALDAS